MTVRPWRCRYPYNPDTPGGCWEYNAGQELIAQSEKKPLKVLLFVSSFAAAHRLHTFPLMCLPVFAFRSFINLPD